MTTTSRLSVTIAPIASSPVRALAPVAIATRLRARPRPRPCPSLEPPGEMSRKGSVVASPGVLKADDNIQSGKTEGPPRRALTGRSTLLGSDRLDVYGLGALVALLRVVGDLCALLQRAVTLAVDPGVMDEEVLVAVIGGDET